MDNAACIVGEAWGVEPVANRCFTNPGLRPVDVIGPAKLSGVHGTVGRTTELDNAETIYLATCFQKAVIVVGHHRLHSIALIASTCTIACEGTLHGTVGIDEVGVVVGCHVHHAECPLCGIPLTIVKMATEDTCIGRTPTVVGTCGYGLVFTQVDAVEQSRVIAFPPFTLAVFQCQIAIIGNTSIRTALV